MPRSNASKDDNGTNSLIGALNTSGELIVTVLSNPSTHKLYIADGLTGANYGGGVSLKDNNFATSLTGVSYVDGKTPVVIFCDINGNLLVDSK